MSSPTGGDAAAHAAVETYCFRVEAFVEPAFSVEDFVKECRLRVPMSELKADLDRYHDSLQNSMFTLINKDYGEFLSLSSNLAGLDKAIKEITSPLGDLQEDVQKLKDAMDSELNELKQRIARRSEIRDRKALCQRYLRISASVEKIEKLLSGAADGTAGETAEEALSRGSGELIERVASEFNQLQFYATQCDRSPFLDALGPRIQSITAMLQKGLELSFRRGLETGDLEVLRQCLRTYAIIDKVPVAEALFRDLAVAPFAARAVTKEAVTSRGLDGVYGDCLAFTSERCSGLSKLAADLNISNCDFVVNSVWPVLADSLGKLGFIFASGIADDFHKNYSHTEKFLGEFELLCGSKRSVERLRAHPQHVAFRRRWSLPVYFQLRFQEIAGAVEELLSEPLKECSAHSRPWRLTVGNAVIALVEQCWAPDVFLPGLTHRFWKLTLQILSRFSSFVVEHCSAAEAPSDVHMALLLLHDTGVLRERVPGFSRFVGAAADASALREALDDAAKGLGDAVVKVRGVFRDRLVDRCAAVLAKCNGISRQYRHTGRKAPTEPSDFVGRIFDPLNEFASTASGLVEDYAGAWEAPVVGVVTARYRDVIAQLLVSSKEMEEKLMRVKKLRKGNKVAGMSDDDKIRLQLWHDVKAYREEVAKTAAPSDDTAAVLADLQRLVDEARPPEDAGGGAADGGGVAAE